MKILLGLSLLLLLLSLQRFYTSPLPHSWEIGIGITEWGHWFAFVGLGLLAISLRFGQWAAALAAGLATLLALSPCLQAWQRGPFSWSRLFLGESLPKAYQTVVYHRDLSMDVYLPEGSARAAVLVVHGGSWCRGSRSDFSTLNRYLAKRGYLVAAMDYALAPQRPYPAALEDLEAALQFVCKTYSLEARQCIWLGRSAGAHLSLLQGYRKGVPRVAGVVAYYAPTDMVWSYDNPSNPRVLDSRVAVRDFLSGTPQERPQAYQEASPLAIVEAQAPPTLLLHGAIDNLVFVRQSQRLAERLRELRVDHELFILPWANHGFDVNLFGPSGQLATAAVERFLVRVLASQ